MLAATQLGFLLHARGDDAGAAPLFDRVLAGPDEELANRVRAVLHMPQVLSRRTEQAPDSIDAKVMAERSIKAGYMKDALKYLQVAHEDDPGDFEAMLKLGWTYNILHEDMTAARWFELARHSPDPKVAGEGRQAWRNLSGALKRFRTTFWVYPIYSTRWHDFFSYAQVKTELHNKTRLQPYLSVRFVGDTRVTVGAVSPQYLSESSFIVGGGVRVLPWHGAGAWFEAGSAMSYATGHMSARLSRRTELRARDRPDARRRILRLVRRHGRGRGLHQPVRQRLPGVRPVAVRLLDGAGRVPHPVLLEREFHDRRAAADLGQFFRNGAGRAPTCGVDAALDVLHHQPAARPLPAEHGGRPAGQFQRLSLGGLVCVYSLGPGMTAP